MGEIDIVARNQSYLCFVEVKYRTNAKMGQPELAVGIGKQNKICRVADFYLLKNRITNNLAIRFDVVAIMGEQISLYKNAFEYIPL